MKTLITILAISSCFCATAQVKKKIKKSRRNKSESRFALAKNDALAEWETGYETFDAGLATAVYPNIVLHYGISNRVEVNTEMSLVTAIDKSVTPQKNTTGIEPVMAGFNYLLRKEGNKDPAIIAAVQIAIPFLASANFTANHFAPVLQLDVQQPITKKLTTGFTPGLFWDGFTTAPSYTYSFNVNYQPVKKWVLSTELFGFINHELPQHSIDAEVDYNINKQWQLGVTSGVGISAAAHKSYFAFNGSYGFNTARKKHA